MASSEVSKLTEMRWSEAAASSRWRSVVLGMPRTPVSPEALASAQPFTHASLPGSGSGGVSAVDALSNRRHVKCAQMFHTLCTWRLRQLFSGEALRVAIQRRSLVSPTHLVATADVARPGLAAWGHWRQMAVADEGIGSRHSYGTGTDGGTSVMSPGSDTVRSMGSGSPSSSLGHKDFEKFEK